MAKVEFDIYRIKFVVPFSDNEIPLDRAEHLILKCLKEAPSKQFKKGFTWHIGNVDLINNTQGSFAIGRTSANEVSKFDESLKKFIDTSDEVSPYSHIVFDAGYGVLAVMRKTQIFPTTDSAASIIKKLFSSCEIIVQYDVDVFVNPIPDPAPFVKKLQSAYAVKGYTATFTGPNPIDSDKYFQQPLSHVAAEARAKEGSATLKGDDLDREVLTEITRSTAATGNTAKAKVIQNKKERARTIHLSGDPVRLIYDDEELDLKMVLNEMLEEYMRVRNESN